MSEIENLPCNFSGMTIETPADGALVHQNPYLRQLEILPNIASFYYSRSASVRLGLLVRTRPECPFDIYQVDQVAEDQFNKEKKKHIKISNRSTDYDRENPLVI